MDRPMSLPIRASVEPTRAAPPCSVAEAYRVYAQRVARWAHNLGGSVIDVEDVVQEVFLVVSRRLPGYRPSGSFTSWLFEIARKVVANHRRRHGRHLVRRESENSLESVPSPEPDPAVALERRLMVALFYRALDQLPEKYRTVFVLYEIEELSTQAIADLCRLNLSTVKVQLVRARARFLHTYQKLVRKASDIAGSTLPEIAEKTVGVGRASVARLGKETS